jgi:hypothetical protein
MRIRSRLVFVAVAALAFTAPDVVAPMNVSAHAGNNATTLIHACVDNASDVVRIVGVHEQCSANETPTHWVNLNRFKQLETALETLQIVVDARQDEVNGIENTVAGLQGTIAGLQASNASLQATVSSLQAAIAGLQGTLEGGLATLQALLTYIKVQDGALNGVSGPHVIIEGANLHVRSGSGQTEDATNLGNVFIGYNEPRLTAGAPDVTLRDGSHNLVVGPEHRYSASGGFVAGVKNTVSGDSASVSGGQGNVASGVAASVSGGSNNKGTGQNSSVSGGLNRNSQGLNDWRAGTLFENQ